LQLNENEFEPERRGISGEEENAFWRFRLVEAAEPGFRTDPHHRRSGDGEYHERKDKTWLKQK
jgi:hypothetical protein